MPKILGMTTIERLTHLDPDKVPYDACKTEEWAWLVLGLDPNPGYYPSTDVVDILAERFTDMIPASAHNYDRLMYTLQKAQKIANELIESDTEM